MKIFKARPYLRHAQACVCLSAQSKAHVRHVSSSTQLSCPKTKIWGAVEQITLSKNLGGKHEASISPWIWVVWIPVGCNSGEGVICCVQMERSSFFILELFRFNVCMQVLIHLQDNKQFGTSKIKNELWGRLAKFGFWLHGPLQQQAGHKVTAAQQIKSEARARLSLCQWQANALVRTQLP